MQQASSYCDKILIVSSFVSGQDRHGLLAEGRSSAGDGCIACDRNGEEECRAAALAASGDEGAQIDERKGRAGSGRQRSGRELSEAGVLDDAAVTAVNIRIDAEE
ncbi:hypothetical protein GCM10007874_50650 [Labrys miyagiensis]|uniref:Uncharacterized protein n=1 Tax=Labrys miyagiensis TaxID=346912 RepID=A0ABQ6CNY4_9HYPH|nr:hypothetical protein GCM10007874_50650 [Labrys miyagiensis]